MRNIVQYPITLEEKLYALDCAINLLSYNTTGLVGDIRPAALQEIKEDLYEKHRSADN